MNLRLFQLLLIIISLAAPVRGTTYFVSPSGNDSKTGLSEGEAWGSIDHGDEKNILQAGDTVNILPGTYQISKTLSLKRAGTSAAPIVHRGYHGTPVIDAHGDNFAIIEVSEKFNWIEGLELTNSTTSGILLQGDSCVVFKCTIHDIDGDGIDVERRGARVSRTVFWRCKQSGIFNKKGARNCQFVCNTMHDANIGVNIQVNEATARVVDNIFSSCTHGLSGVVGNVAAFNLFFDNKAGDYFGGIADSAGGITADPKFIDTAAGNFHLGFNSPAIDAGLPEGCPYNGLAPDLGAFETAPLQHLEFTSLHDTLSSDSSYAFPVLAHDSMNDPAPHGILSWSTTIPSASIDSIGNLIAPIAGTGTVTVTSSIGGIEVQSGLLHVVAGTPMSLTIAPDTLTLSAGQTHAFSAFGFDKNGNVVADAGTIGWGVTGTIGTIDPSGLFTGRLTGRGAITASSNLGLNATSGSVQVSPGPLASIDVLPANNVVQTLTAYQYAALGYDAYSNFIADFTDSVNWSTTDLLGNVNISGRYTAGLIGSYWVKASTSGLRDSGLVNVTLAGGLDHIRIERFNGTVVGALNLTTDNDTTNLYVRGYTASNALIGDVSVDWQVMGSATVLDLSPNIGARTAMIVHRPGSVKVIVRHNSGLADTTGAIVISTGAPTTLAVAPATASLRASETAQFVAPAYDADENLVNPQPIIVWSVSNGIGTISGGGLFTAKHSGQGRLIATAGSLVDSSELITVSAGDLVSIRIEPDTVIARIGDTVQFIAIGVDALGNDTDPGVITWKATGRVGSVDGSGRYVATAPGSGSVSAFNPNAGIADTTGKVRIEELYFSTLPLGNAVLRSGGQEVTVAEFRIDNFFSTSKTISSIAIRDLSSGEGTAEEVAGNVVAARLYLDRDQDSVLSAGDSLLSETPYAAGSMEFSIAPLELQADSGVTLLATATSSANARDGDTLDVALVPGVDIVTSDLTGVSGPGLSNSFGITRIDGMVASQLHIIPSVIHTLETSDSLEACFTVDLPKNGYQRDTLIGLTVVNAGSAAPSDFDSLVLFADNGDNHWSGAGHEIALGRLAYNGESWSRGGLSVPIIDSVKRFYIASRLNRFPTNGATLKLGVPVDGIRMSSGNDGPIDTPAQSVDTLVIQGRQAVIVSALPLSSGVCTPGSMTGPLLGVQFTNGYGQAVTLDSCAFTFIGTDPQSAGTIQLGSQIDSVYLYWDKDGDLTAFGPADSLISASTLTNGTASFSTAGITIASNGGHQTMVVAAKLNLLNCKNGNSIAFSLADTSGVKFTQVVKLTGSFPIKGNASFLVNAFPASAVAVHALSSENLYAGQTNVPVLDFELPRNGYASDKLTTIKLINSGSISETSVLDNVRLWNDVTGNGFSADDTPIGDFGTSVDGWMLDNLKVSLKAPLNRFIVTVSISDKQFDGGTLRFELPVSGVVTGSGMTGPDDEAAKSPSSFLIFPSNRVTAISIPLGSTLVPPAGPEKTIMTFALYNGYVGQSKTLSQVTLTNSSHSSGQPVFADHELGQVSLYLDVNRDRVLEKDRLIGTGLFSNGTLRLDGLAVQIPPESLAYLFVTTLMPLDLIDGDSLAVSIVQPTDFSFTDVVNLNGDLPLSSGGYMIVNGSINRQFRLFGPSGRSLAPGDTAAVLLTFSPAINGDNSDNLTGLALTNLGTADNTTVSGLQLWHDINRDEVLDGGDSVLGTFGYSAGRWTLGSLSLAVASPAPNLLVVGSIADSALPGATIRMEIPNLACSYQSGNDGPVDSALTAPGLFTVSTSGLRVSLGSVKSAYSVGQTIDVSLTITNVTSGSIDAVTGHVLTVLDSTLVRLDSVSAGPLNLTAGEEITGHFYFTALGEGSVLWRLRAESESPVDSSIVIQTPSSMIQRAISSVSPQVLSTSPTAVTKGQTNVFPMTIVCGHPDTNQTSAAMMLQSLHIEAISDQAVPIPANSAFSRVVMATGSEILAVDAALDSDPNIFLTFSHPILIAPGKSQNLLLIVDVASNASASNFRLSIDSSTWLPLLDANTGQVIATSASTVFPMRTATTRIDSPSQQIAVSTTSISLPTVNYNQLDAGVLKLRLRHTGQQGSSSAQFSRLHVQVVDSSGQPVAAGDFFSTVSVWRQNFEIGSTIPAIHDTSAVDISLSNPINLNALELDSVIVAVSVKSATVGNGFRLRIADSTQLVMRDLNTGSSLLAISDTALTHAGTFPVVSNWCALRFPADHPTICMTDVAPSSVLGGVDTIALLALTLAYPASSQHSKIRMTTMRVGVVNADGNEIDPEQLFDRIGIRVNGGPSQYNSVVATSGREMVLSLADTGLVLGASDSLYVELIGDLRLEAPYRSFGLRISNLTKFDAQDMSDPNRGVSAISRVGCAESFPFASTVTEILLPAGRPIAKPTAHPVQIAAKGRQKVVLFEGTLQYRSPSPLGDIEILGLNADLKRASPAGSSVEPVSLSISKVEFEVDGRVLGADSALTDDRVVISTASPKVVTRGEELPIRVTCNIAADAPPGNIALTFADSTFMTIHDKGLMTSIYPVLTATTYPATAGEISVVPIDLKGSFTNYPNPFNPGHGEQTVIGFSLEENAYVDIDIFTITGELVAGISSRSLRTAGTYQSDSWSGKNDGGQAVLPGVYYCRIAASYISGRVETFRRKVAVVR